MISVSQPTSCLKFHCVFENRLCPCSSDISEPFYVAQVGHKTQRSACLCLQDAEIKGVVDHAWFWSNYWHPLRSILAGFFWDSLLWLRVKDIISIHDVNLNCLKWHMSLCFVSLSRNRKLSWDCLNLEAILSLWNVCTWCYVRACIYTHLCSKTFLANLEFFLLIMCTQGQRGLRFVWVLCSHEQEGQDNVGSCKLSHHQLKLYDVWLK